MPNINPTLLLIQLFLFTIPLSCHCQSIECIVQLSSHSTNESIEFAKQVRVLAAPLGINLIAFPATMDSLQIARQLRSNSSIRAFSWNARITPRHEPNDNLYSRQVENFARTNFPTVWRTTVGEAPASGLPQPVIAVLDAGFELTHEDLRDNIWRNPHERPGDGLDNDDNGYIDDIVGWDMAGDDPNPPGDTHGTQVAGLIGARGDNEIGIAGANWNTQLMLLSFRTVAEVIEAYEYVRVQRRRWNESGGTRGAFVVATNASFGVEGGTCADFPIWGQMYEELGRVGVLTAAATANFSWNVDQNGDMPTDCPSDYLIGVANLAPDDRLFSSSAFGRVNVDLAAPGEGSYSLLPASNYGPFGSTSAAAPYVTGAIALMYATPCPAFSAVVREDPAGAALFVREALLSTVQTLPGLTTRVATGGMLDAAAAQAYLLATCSESTAGSLSITAAQPNPSSGLFRLITNSLILSPQTELTVVDVAGRVVHGQTVLGATGAPLSIRVDLTGLPIGVYFVSLQDRERRAHTRLIIH